MNTTINNIPNIQLSNKVQMPIVGLGVLKAQEGGEVEQAIASALQAGYRLIDTASVYRNEAGVGRALQNSNVPREEIFLTTKVWNSDQGYQQTMAAFEESLRKLQTDYVDLYLVHWPVAGKYRETWRAMEEIYRSGRAKAIGVSNFQVHHLQDLMEVAEITPMVNQIEMHPWLQQNELRAFSEKHHIRLEAWRPIMMGKVMELEPIQALAKQYAKSPVQIALRWLTQLGVIVIPKSTRPERIAENRNLFDFELSPAEMQQIAQLDRGQRLGPDPDNFNF